METGSVARRETARRQRTPHAYLMPCAAGAALAGKARGAHVRIMVRVCPLIPPGVLRPCLATRLPWDGSPSARVIEGAHAMAIR